MTQSTFTIDKKIRDAASKRAKVDQLSVSAVARMLLRDYAEGRITIGTQVMGKYERIEVDAKTQKKMDSIWALWKTKRWS